MTDSGVTGRHPAANPPNRARRADLDALAADPRPAVSRAALAARYPSWGLATLSMMAVGLIACFASLGPLGAAIEACRSDPALFVCRPKMHAVVVVLPVVALMAGLAVSILGGRLIIRVGQPPLRAAGVGWVVFVAGTLAAFLLSGAL